MGIITNRAILEALPVAKVEAKSVLFAGHFVMKRELKLLCVEIRKIKRYHLGLNRSS